MRKVAMGTLEERRVPVLTSEMAVLHLKLTCPCWQVSSDTSEFLVLQQRPEVCLYVCVYIYIYIYIYIYTYFFKSNITLYKNVRS